MFDYEIVTDLDTAKHILNLTETSLAEGLGVPRSTIAGWRTGKTKPSPLMLENVYDFIYRNGIFLNQIKEQYYRDLNSSSRIHLFHGAKTSWTENPSLDHTKRINDFGKGLYMGESYSQSASFVFSYPGSSVYVLDLEISEDLRISEFNVDETWMLAIAYYRNQLKEYESHPIIQNVLKNVEGYDLVKAPIADNRMFQILDEYINGNITDLQCKSALSATDLGKQYVAISDKAIDRLKVVNHCYICKSERRFFESEKSKAEALGSQKVKYVKREFAGKGKYIDELLA